MSRSTKPSTSIADLMQLTPVELRRRYEADAIKEPTYLAVCNEKGWPSGALKKVQYPEGYRGRHTGRACLRGKRHIAVT